MNTETLVARAFEAFCTDATSPPPLTLRGGSAVDSYDLPPPFDQSADEPTDAYLEGFAYWGLGYLDARSWRHYLPTLIGYAFRRPDDPAMVTEALVRSLRPPDRYPPRLASLTREQEDVIRSFLEQAAMTDTLSHVQDDAQQALDEWWLPHARSRPTAEEIAALRAVPITYRVVARDVYRLSVPETFTGSGVRDIPSESRRVETWAGPLCGDAHTVVAINVTPLVVRSLDESVRARMALFRNAVVPQPVVVAGSRHARRLDGLSPGTSPAEPQTLVMVFAATADELVTMSIKSWPREDIDREVERMARSLELVAP